MATAMGATPTLGELARDVANRLRQAGIASDEARLDAELLIRTTLGWDRARWVAYSDAVVPASLPEALQPLVRRRAAREPMAYLLGRCEFWGLEFEITPAVLIPRPETEIVVEQTLKRLPPATGATDGITLCDIGTGSGCIAVSLAVERADARVIATDVSAPALDVARRNAGRHGVSSRIVFEEASLAGTHREHPVHAVVSNPPYVPVRELESLPPEVRNYEPRGALDGGEDGLDVIRAIIALSAERLHPGGWLVFEFGFGQADAVRALLVSDDWRGAELIADLQEIPRTAVAQKASRR
jgi:release factor glutamine methyltransferase